MIKLKISCIIFVVSSSAPLILSALIPLLSADFSFLRLLTAIPPLGVSSLALLGPLVSLPTVRRLESGRLLATSRTSSDDEWLQTRLLLVRRAALHAPVNLGALPWQPGPAYPRSVSAPKVKSMFLNCCSSKCSHCTQQARLVTRHSVHSLELQLRATALVVRIRLDAPVAFVEEHVVSHVVHL